MSTADVAPSASASVTTAGRDSGTAATTRLIAVTTISSAPWPQGQPYSRHDRGQRHRGRPATSPSTRPRQAGRRCSGVSPCRAPISAATRPIALAAPVAVTTARPRPRTTVVRGHAITVPASCRRLLHRHGLARQGRLVHQQRRRLHHGGIGGHDVALGKHQHVPGHHPSAVMTTCSP